MPTLAPEIVPDDLHFDLGAGEECQQDGAEAGKEVDPGRDFKADGVARDGAHDDLDERHRDGHPDGNDRRGKRQGEPDR